MYRITPMDISGGLSASSLRVIGVLNMILPKSVGVIAKLVGEVNKFVCVGKLTTQLDAPSYSTNINRTNINLWKPVIGNSITSTPSNIITCANFIVLSLVSLKFYFTQNISLLLKFKTHFKCLQK